MKIERILGSLCTQKQTPMYNINIINTVVLRKLTLVLIIQQAHYVIVLILNSNDILKHKQIFMKNTMRQTVRPASALKYH